MLGVKRVRGSSYRRGVRYETGERRVSEREARGCSRTLERTVWSRKDGWGERTVGERRDGRGRVQGSRE